MQPCPTRNQHHRLLTEQLAARSAPLYELKVTRHRYSPSTSRRWEAYQEILVTTSPLRTWLILSPRLAKYQLR
jgi:hypothetical protein